VNRSTSCLLPNSSRSGMELFVFREGSAVRTTARSSRRARGRRSWAEANAKAVGATVSASTRAQPRTHDYTDSARRVCLTD
jgi:hypothetical protein